MRRKWALVLVLVPVGMYACGTELTIRPDPGDGDGDGGDGSAGADASPGDSPSSADAEPCRPKTCGEVGAKCGAAPDGCGNALADCGVCSAGELCGAGGPNLCGDGGCDAATSCGLGHCGTISNGCGATIDCGGCTGTTFCEGASNTCASCQFYGSDCNTGTGGATCPLGSPGPGTLYTCDQPPGSPGCLNCPNLTSGGKTLLYCCH